LPVSDEWAWFLTALRSPVHASGHEQLVRQTLALTRDVAAGTVGCSLTEIDGAGYRTPIASSPLARELDHTQRAVSRGRASARSATTGPTNRRYRR
jgi:hypothetical protein